MIPLRAHLSERGTLVVIFDPSPDAPSLEERELLASFADQAALALDRARAVADRQELALISDRERIARDLHDVVIQRLFATGLQLQGIRGAAEKAEVIERIDQTVDDLDLTIRDIRSTIFELQDRATDSVRHDVRALVEEYAPALGLTPRLTTHGPIDAAVPPQVREHLMAVLREALSNVTRHARADHVEVDIQVSEDRLRLSVNDDGAGLPGAVVESGLRNVRRRAEELGGALELAAGEPRGTRLVWHVPLS